MRKALAATVGLIVLPVGWIVSASFGLCALEQRTDLFVWPYTEWLQAARYVWPRRWLMGWEIEAQIVAAMIVPTLLTVAVSAIVVRLWRRYLPLTVYGRTDFATPKQMQTGGISTRGRPF